MKVNLELIIHEEPDGRVFLNYWDREHGNDVCAQIIDGKAYEMVHNEEGNVSLGNELSLPHFIKLVQNIVSQQRS